VNTVLTTPTFSREEFYDFLMLKFGIVCSSTLNSRQLMRSRKHSGGVCPRAGDRC